MNPQNTGLDNTNQKEDTTDLITREQVIEVEKKLLNAIKNSIISDLDNLLHTDLLFHIPDGQIITKAMDLEAHRSGTMVVNSIAADEPLISIIGNTAVVSVLIEVQGKISDQPMGGKLRYIRVWKLFKNKLQVIAGSCIRL